MSRPFLEYVCTRCSWEAVPSPLNFDFVYELGDHTVPVITKYAWCNHCATVRSCEDIPSEKRIVRLRESISSLRTQSSNGDYLTDIKTGDERAFTAEKKQFELQQLLTVLSVANNRASGPKCLKCFGEDIVDIARGPLQGTETKFTGILHPECGGEIHERWSELWVSVKRASRPEFRLTRDGYPAYSIEIIELLRNQILGVQRVLYGFFVDRLKIQDKNLDKMEITYFSCAVVVLPYLEALEYSEEAKNYGDTAMEIAVELSIRNADPALGLERATLMLRERWEEYAPQVGLLTGKGPVVLEAMPLLYGVLCNYTYKGPTLRVIELVAAYELIYACLQGSTSLINKELIPLHQGV
jgi:hypothetical protein